MEEAAHQTFSWMDAQSAIEVEIGCLVSAASEWTEDETELDDLICGLVDSGQVQIYL
jgi:hypothetical protein